VTFSQSGGGFSAAESF